MPLFLTMSHGRVSNKKVQLTGVALVAFTLIFFCPISKTSAQKRLQSEGVKVNINYRKNLPNEGYTVGNIAPAFMLSNKRLNFHEIELNTFDINKGERSLYDQNGALIQVADVRFFAIGIRYQFTWNIIKKDQQKIVPQLGISFLSLFRSTSSEPQLHNAFRTKFTEFNEYLGLVPQVRYNVSKRISMELAFPLDFIYYQSGLTRIYNHNVPRRNQKSGRMLLDFQDFNTLLKYSHIRFGVAAKF